MKEITLPDVSKLPDAPAEAAAFIWREQDKLNAVSHPAGRGTIAAGQVLAAGERMAVVEDYLFALHAEVHELYSSYFWKHWSAEAKQGRRFELIHQDQAAGEGTAQNVLVEVIDILFFTTSLLQVLGYGEKDWVAAWGESDWSRNLGNPAKPADARRLCARALELQAAAGAKPFHGVQDGCRAITLSMIELCGAAGLGWRETLHLYAQKLVKNYERQLRGRKQVGDSLAEKENAAVTLPPPSGDARQ